MSIPGSPIRQVSILENLQFSLRPQDLDTASIFQVEFSLANERSKFQLNLHPTRNLLSHQTDVQHVKPDGSSSRLVSRASPLVYKGHTSILGDDSKTWKKAGWARVMVRRRQDKHLIEGAFSVDGVHHHIVLDSNLHSSQLSKENVRPKTHSPQMLVWKDSDDIDSRSVLRRSSANETLCAAENAHDRRSFPLGSSHVNGLLRRQNDWFDPTDVIGSTDGCPSSRLVAMIGVATDCTYTAEFDSIDDTRENIISQINIASQVYEDTFNISLAIRNLTISDASCPASPSNLTRWNVPCSSRIDLSRRLRLFSDWRIENPDDNAVWTLLSTCSSGSTIGTAWVGNTCTSGSSSRSSRSVASTNVVARTDAEWQVIAHEMAHNFGAEHDCTSDTCRGNSATEDCCPLSESTCDADEQYIMNPQSRQQHESFSPCTIGSICTAMGRDLIDTSCLVGEGDAPDINDSQCGNGIVEAGEACDCGGEGCPEDSCCDPNTCQLRSGAECDPASDGCCTDQCQVAESGRVCRASAGPGDPEETCDGSSSQCPEDDRGGDESGSWFDNNRTTVIAVSVSVGGVLVIVIVACVISCGVKRHKKAGTRLRRDDSLGTGSDDRFVPIGQVPTAPPMAHRYS